MITYVSERMRQSTRSVQPSSNTMRQRRAGQCVWMVATGSDCILRRWRVERLPAAAPRPSTCQAARAALGPPPSLGTPLRPPPQTPSSDTLL